MSERQIRFTPPAFPDDDPEILLHVVLVEPEIPQNTGNVARLCAGTRAWLHLVEPLSFMLEDRHLRRAGLDYWPRVRLSVHASLSSCLSLLPWERTWLFTRRAERRFTEVSYPRGAVLVYGRETTGLPSSLLETRASHAVRIPTSDGVRSLNVANTVGIGAYEVLRQLDWPGETPMPGRDTASEGEALSGAGVGAGRRG